MTELLGLCQGKCALARVKVTNQSELLESIDADTLHDTLTERFTSVLRAEDKVIGHVNTGGYWLVFDSLIDLNHLHLAALKLSRKFEPQLDAADRSADIRVGMAYLARPSAEQIQQAEQTAKQALTAAQASKTHDIYHIATLQDETEVDSHWEVAQRIREAMERHAISMDYQPKIDLSSGDVVGGEALVRWRENGTVVPPSDFLPALADDAMWELTAYTIRLVIRDIIEHDIQIPIAVNLDPSVLKHLGLASFLIQETSFWGVDPQMIVLEITENTQLYSLQETSKKLQDLRDHGFRVSIDDFGTGHSNLRRVRELPVDEIKLDRSFCQNLASDLGNQVITKGVLELAKKLNLPVGAEGIEDAGTLNALIEWGCPIGQGFYLGAPLPVDDFRHLIR